MALSIRYGLIKYSFLKHFQIISLEYDMNSMESITFTYTLLNNLNKNAPLKKMYLVANHSKLRN